MTARNINLTVTPGGKLLITTPGGRQPGLDETRAIRDGARLIVGYLTGTPVHCEVEHDGNPPFAQTIAAVDVAVCAEHAR